MKATIQTVAHEAGVSIMTVSRVIRNHPKVSKETRDKVLAILQKQGYRRSPFHAAWHVSWRGDRVASQPSIMFLCGEAEERLKHHPWIAEIWRGVKERAEALGMMVSYLHVDPTKPTWERIGGILKARGVNGVVLGPLPARCAPIELPFENLALAAADYCQPLMGIHRATQNHFDGMRRVFSRLLAAGYARLGIVGTNAPDERACQWMGSFLENQLWLPEEDQIPALRVGGPDSEKNFRQWCRKFRPDVIISAVGEVVHWTENLPRSRPKPPDMFLLDLHGPCPIEQNISTKGEQRRSPKLSGLIYPGAQIGAASVELMAAQLRHYEHGMSAQPKTFRIESTFQEGQSCRLGGNV